MKNNIKYKYKWSLFVFFILLSLSVLARNSPKFSGGEVILDNYPEITIEIEGNGNKTVNLFYETDAEENQKVSYSDQILGNGVDLVYTSGLELPVGSIVKVYFHVRNGSGSGGATNTDLELEYTVPEVVPEIPEPEIPSTPVVTSRKIKINSKISNQSKSRESEINMTKTDDKEDFDIESIRDTSSE